MAILDKKNKEQVKEYDNFVRHFDGASLMQSLNWTKVKSNWDCEAIYIKKEGKIVAAMTVLIEKVPFMKKTLMYAPRGPVCDVYDIDLVKEIVKEADVLAKKYNAFLLKFDPNEKYDEKLEKIYTDNGFKVIGKNKDKDKLIQPLHDMILYLDGYDEESLMKTFAEKTRYNIRLAKRKGVEVYHSRSKEDLKTFYELYKITTIRDKIGCRSYEYFEKMLDTYDENSFRIYIAKHGDDKLSGALAFNYGKELFYLYGASSNEKRNLMPNYLMQWEMIKWGIETHCKKYNFGGVLNLEPNNGLYKFKIGFCKKDGVTEYIGEIDRVYGKFLYFVYNDIYPMLKKAKITVRNMIRK